MEALKHSSAYDVFKNFSKLSEIPRCSHDEERISNFVYEWGKSLGLEASRDSVGNVIIIKNATPGYENHDGLVLQAHLDMVCEKTEDSVHDFSCDPIELLIDGDYIHANKTTLGADDGIGAALIMAILEDNTISHPKIEALFTTTEETGMDGAFGLSKDALTGKNLINLDNEEDWMIFIGCAGGITAYIDIELENKEMPHLANFEIRISGLKGGHSGAMIHENRLNAIKELGNVLGKLKSEISFNLKSINGGSKHNAIPSNAVAVVGVEPNKVEDFKEILTRLILESKDLNIKRELDLKFEFKQIEGCEWFIQDEIANKIIRIIQLFPHGVNTMDKELGVVKSSNNLAIVSSSDFKLEITTSIRSSDPDDLAKLKNIISELAGHNGFNINFSEGYPMWKPNFDNHLLNRAKESYREVSGKEAEIAVIHAGLETGIFSEKFPHMNMISVGPNVTGAHTPNERLSIKSTEFVFNFLKHLIKNL